MYFKLVRKYGANITLGTLQIRGNENEVVKEYATIELPDKNNENGISCIPADQYEVEVLRNSPAIKYEHLSIVNVPNRSGIKIHVANYVSQLRGCIAPGLSHVDMNNDGIIDVTSSTTALKQILDIVKKYGFDSENKRRFKLFIE